MFPDITICPSTLKDDPTNLDLYATNADGTLHLLSHFHNESTGVKNILVAFQHDGAVKEASGISISSAGAVTRCTTVHQTKANKIGMNHGVREIICVCKAFDN